MNLLGNPLFYLFGGFELLKLLLIIFNLGPGIVLAEFLADDFKLLAQNIITLVLIDPLFDFSLNHSKKLQICKARIFWKKTRIFDDSTHIFLHVVIFSDCFSIYQNCSLRCLYKSEDMLHKHSLSGTISAYKSVDFSRL